MACNSSTRAGCRPIAATGELLAPEEGYHGVNPSHPVVRQERLDALEKLAATRRQFGAG